MYRFQPKGICAREIRVELDGDTIKQVEFVGGCDGNTKAIAKLVAGQNVDHIIEILAGNTCGRKPTSCADQLTKALTEARAAS